MKACDRDGSYDKRRREEKRREEKRREEKRAVRCEPRRSFNTVLNLIGKRVVEGL